MSNVYVMKSDIESDSRVSADMIATFLSEEARIEGGRIANISYLAVGIAERIERGEFKLLNEPARKDMRS